MKRFGLSRPTAYPVQRGCGHLLACGRGDSLATRDAGAGAVVIRKIPEPIPPCSAIGAH